MNTQVAGNLVAERRDSGFDSRLCDVNDAGKINANHYRFKTDRGSPGCAGAQRGDRGMIRTRHQIPGRVRLRIQPLTGNHALASRFERHFSGVDGVLEVSCNPGCASLALRYQESLIDAAALKSMIDAILLDPMCAEPADAETDTAIQCRGCRQTTQKDKKNGSWFWRLLGFGLLCGYLGYVLVREHLLKRPVAQSALSPTGLIALIGALPLLRDAWHETFTERRFTIHQFLAFSLVLAILVGEALTAFEIIFVLHGGRLLETYVANRSRREIRRMLSLSIKDTWVVIDGAEILTPVAELKAGDLVVIRTGEKIPVDGEIEQGAAELSEAAITGRAEPVYKTQGERVFAGSYLEQGVLYVRACEVGEDTYLARIAALVDASLDQKAPLQERADVLAARLLKLGTVSTLGTLVLTQSLSRALTVMLVMSCPCSTILAASTAVSAAIHNAARRQILVKGGIYLEQIGGAQCWCFDKTGTLTTETPEVAEVVAEDAQELLFWAASAEQHNPHALAHAIVEHARDQGVEPEQHALSEHLLGQGVKAQVRERTVLLGNARLLEAERLRLNRRLRHAAEEMSERGLTSVYVALDREVLGVLGIRHQLRPGVRETLEALRAEGVTHLCLISGDEPAVAEGLSRELGLDSCHAGLLPQDKAEVVRQLRRDHGSLVMVGDGVNDALALSEAEIGIAMGAGGSEVAIEIADIALADSDVRKLIAIRRLSNRTLRTADQNYAFAVVTDLAGVVLGALGILSPAMGGIIHISHTLGILLNSSRLLAHRPD